MKTTLLTVFLALSAFVLTGCLPAAYNVEVYLSPKFKQQLKVVPSLEVDVVGVSADEGERFAACVVDEYFQVGGSLRNGTLHRTLYFSSENALPKRMKTGDKMWKQFRQKDASNLYLLVNLPWESSAPALPRDGRKAVIPLKRSWLWQSRTRYFEINPAGITLLKSRPDEEAAPEGVQ